VSRARLEAFSDGVIAVAITLLALDLAEDLVLVGRVGGVHALRFQERLDLLARAAGRDLGVEDVGR